MKENKLVKKITSKVKDVAGHVTDWFDSNEREVQIGVAVGGYAFAAGALCMAICANHRLKKEGLPIPWLPGYKK